jgi:hypothetical protein
VTIVAKATPRSVCSDIARQLQQGFDRANIDFFEVLHRNVNNGRCRVLM